MEQRSRKKRTGKIPMRMMALLLLTAAMIINCASVLSVITPKRYDVAVNGIAKESVYAVRTIEDEAATGALRERARNAVEPVMDIDGEKVKELISKGTGFFESLSSIRAEASGFIPASAAPASAQQWDSALLQEQKERLCAVSAPQLDEDMLCAMLASDNTDIAKLKAQILRILSESLNGGLSEVGVSSVRARYIQELKMTEGLSDELKRIGEAVLIEYLQPTLALDEAATNAARDAAAASVESVYISKGSVIVEAGDTVTEAKYALMAQLGIVNDGTSGWLAYLGAVLLIGAAYAAFYYYISQFEKEVFADTKRMLIIVILIVITMLLSLLTVKADPRMSPVLIACILSALLVGERTALALNILLSLSAGIIAGGTNNVLQFDSFVLMAASAVGGTAAVFTLRKKNNRGVMIASGAFGGAAASVVVAGAYFLTGANMTEMLITMAWVFCSALLCALLAVGSLSIWETVFDIATAARLNELSNTNHPLLKQLITEAPGTYHHSMMTAALAEAAAQRIGADPLLARVGAYYHDVGKLRRPQYFIENQMHGENIHNTMSPSESASVITAHQKDGTQMLAKYKLPGDVIRIVSEHHGNSLVSYFYNKALGMAGSPNAVNVKQYRYSGNRPSTRESAVVMLADCCEAAVRSLGDTSMASVEEMVRKIIDSKLFGSDEQMSSAPLMLADFKEIEKAFIKTFAAIRHERIQYTDKAVKGKDK